jgi:phosphopantothenoylcysteine decarboxylase/phosphopantothenate--cysteine ligase
VPGAPPARDPPRAQSRHPGGPVARHATLRPRLVVGFAAETQHVTENAVAKRLGKGCDWIVANDVSGDVMGGVENAVHLVTADGVEDWPRMPKDEVARLLAARIAEALA